MHRNVFEGSEEPHYLLCGYKNKKARFDSLMLQRCYETHPVVDHYSGKGDIITILEATEQN